MAAEIRQAPLCHRLDAFLEVVGLAQPVLLLQFVLGRPQHEVGQPGHRFSCVNRVEDDALPREHEAEDFRDLGVKRAVALLDVLVHPQSVIHSMVEYDDGSVLAQLGNPDMRTPIANALAHPERIDAGVAARVAAATSRHEACCSWYPGRLVTWAIKEGKNAVTWTELSCRTFKDRVQPALCSSIRMDLDQPENASMVCQPMNTSARLSPIRACSSRRPFRSMANRPSQNT